MAYFFSPFFLFLLSPILLSFFFLSAAATRKKQKGNPTAFFEKPVRKLGFGLLFLFKNKIGTQKFSPPAGKSGSALLCPPAALVVGAKFFKFRFRELPPALPPASSPCSSGSLLANSEKIP
ncbi:hypothetical protein SLEP1_g47784 [Rubroshorea leprosula]|uniref:Secreted protein n=1 Tax=Rubroshorea leprosula TaxID=152421 RepID=A0AAV5LRN0_9ROSI|nr:hypothetical protein SLEP1_g47784 [Rubroshorea leprosula]